MKKIERVKYKVTKKKNKEIRKQSGNPFDEFDKLGTGGTVVSVLADEVTKPLRNKISYDIVGLQGYRSGEDPAQGSDMYNKVYLKAGKFLKLLSKIFVGLLLGGSVIGILFAEAGKRIRIIFVTAFVCLLLSGIKGVLGKFKKR